MKTRKRIKASGSKTISSIKSKKGKNKKDLDFEVEGLANEKILKKGIDMESDKMKQRSRFYWGVIIGGAILAILDVRDEGMMFEGLGIKFAGSLIGSLIIILGIIGMMKNNPKVKIK